MKWKYILKTLLKNKMRSALTALGIIIGVWAVIVLIGIGSGLREYVTDQFESLGSNLIYVMPFNEERLQSRGGASFGQGSAVSFEESDLRILQRIEEIENIIPIVSLTGAVTHKSEQLFTEINGSTTDFLTANNYKVEKGRLFNNAEARRAKRVAVIGAKIEEELFQEGEDVLGKKIEFNDKYFIVVGVLEKKGSRGIGSDIDNQFIIPYRTGWQLTGKNEFNYILAVAKNKDLVNTVKESIKQALSEKYDPDDFSVVDQTEILGMINDILGIFTVALTGIATISLIVGGVGIMNVMFVSVTERTKEIGLRKAVGATTKNILFQFLAESVLLSLIGGILGFVLAVVTVLVINKFFPASITWWATFLALVVSAGVGIIFGIIPSRKASRLAPVEALRYE
jgi:putative ABC transport system permease protein